MSARESNAAKSSAEQIAEPKHHTSAPSWRAPLLLMVPVIAAGASAGIVILPGNNTGSAVFFAVVHASVLASFVAWVLVGLVGGLLGPGVLVRWRTWTTPTAIIFAVIVGGIVARR